MRRFVHLFIPIFIAVATLVVIAKFQLETTQESREIPQMDVDRLFVKVNEDALLNAIRTAFDEKVKVSNKTDFVITSANGYLIDDATKGASDIELLNKVASDRFECKSINNKYTISLKKEDGYVDCPVMLLIPILHVLKDKGVTQ